LAARPVRATLEIAANAIGWCVSTPVADRLAAERPDHVWALDYQLDQTTDGRILKLLNMVDEFTHEYLESFGGRLRDELLTVAASSSLLAARVLVEDWRIEYNSLRPHSALGQGVAVGGQDGLVVGTGRVEAGRVGQGQRGREAAVVGAHRSSVAGRGPEPAPAAQRRRPWSGVGARGPAWAAPGLG
jgi:hypothetical protein